MSGPERDELLRQAKAAGLDKLNDAQFAEFERVARTAADLTRRLPKDLSWTDEPAHVFRLTPRAGDKP